MPPAEAVLVLLAALQHELEKEDNDLVVVTVPRSGISGGWQTGFTPGSRLHTGLSSLVTGHQFFPMDLVSVHHQHRLLLTNKYTVSV